VQGMVGKHVAVLIGDGFEEIEVTEPKRALEEAGATVTIVGPNEESKTRGLRGRRGLEPAGALQADVSIDEVTAADFDAALIPGGVSPDRIRTHKAILKLVKELDGERKPLAAIGHGAQVLISAHAVRGRTLTGAPSIADDIRNAGGLYRDQPAVQDGNWVTCRSANDLDHFERAFLEKLAQFQATPLT